MDKQNLPVNNVRVAIISESDDRRLGLKEILENNGVRVNWDAPYHKYDKEQLGSTADVLLVDLDDSSEQEMYFIDQLVEQSNLPILFNDSGMQFSGYKRKDWGKKLVEKLSALAHTHAPTIATSVEKQASARKIGAVAHPNSTTIPDATTVRCNALSNDAAQHVWVLGASIGGPQSLKRFLAELPAELEMAFVLAQHIGANFVPLLAEQLNRVTQLAVSCAVHGETIRNGQVILAPAELHFSVSPSGCVQLGEITEHFPYSPSIDSVMLEIADGYGENSGGILFSGMGNDGLRGARKIVDYGGAVWAQDAQTCVISSMVDYAREAGLVEFSGTPEQLCESVIAYNQKLRASTNEEYQVRN